MEGGQLNLQSKIENKLCAFQVKNSVGVGGWLDKLRIMLNSAQLQLKLPVGAELGN